MKIESSPVWNLEMGKFKGPKVCLGQMSAMFRRFLIVGR